MAANDRRRRQGRRITEQQEAKRRNALYYQNGTMQKDPSPRRLFDKESTHG